MRFKDIIGQKEIVKFLRGNINSGRIAHAQLFEGESGYGTLALALAYVQYINCKAPLDGDSCEQCSSCKKISSLQHPDLHFVFPVNKSDMAVNLGKNTPTISDNFIGSWREYLTETAPPFYISQNGWYDKIKLNSKTLKPIINKREADLTLQKLTLKPLESDYTTIIIWLPEHMNESAANTLLKQFEEPITNALFIFITEDSSKIIKTILSRTQSITIPPIDRENIEKYLTNKFPEKPQSEIKLVSRISSGSIHSAVQYLSQEGSEIDAGFEVFKSLMRFCYLNKHMELLDWVDSFLELNKEQMDSFFTSSIDVLRYSYMENIGMPQLNNSYKEKRDFIIKFYPFISSKNIESLIANFEEASFHLSRNGHIKIVMTHFALSITKLISPKK